ncbi:MAG: hypothetical protein ACLFWD_14145 [Anaerolineales bacterium]
MRGDIFTAGWTPGAGATLASILTLGMSQEISGQAMLLASGYALGVGILFLALASGTLPNSSQIWSVPQAIIFSP